MSYEGYGQCICENGHRFDVDCHSDDVCCHICECKATFYNPVDDTNGDSVGIILNQFWDKLLVSEQKTQKCNLGHTHVIHEAIYRIPSPKELIEFRYYQDHSGRWRRLSDDKQLE